MRKVLLAWTTTHTDGFSKLVADTSRFSAAEVLAGNQLRRLLVGALELRALRLVASPGP